MRMRFSIEELLESGLIKKIPSSKQKSEESIKTAYSWIAEAENNLQNNALRSSLLSSYLAMFHAARALLFINGFREKSHFAVARFLEDMYVRRNLLEEKWIKILDHYRQIRHNDQYSTSFIITNEEAEEALHYSKLFVERMKNLLHTQTE